jgi:hypothetical protein
MIQIVRSLLHLLGLDQYGNPNSTPAEHLQFFAEGDRAFFRSEDGDIHASL